MTVQEVDRELAIRIGRRVRQARVMTGLSQSQLADALGLTFQQVQKYETGRNRISAPILCRAAQALECPVSFFLQDCGPEDEPPAAQPLGRQALEVARRFSLLPPRERSAVARLIATLARER